MKIKFLQRQRTLSLILISLLMTAGIAIANAQVPTGAINGVFSVGENTVVYFSQGNLQYKASTNKWQFATHQYDYIGSANSNISSTYTGWIDLFGWGTSGYHDSSDPYNVNYQPWSTSYATVNSDYNYFGYGPSTNMSDPNLTGSSSNYDWGVYNAISNGGNTASTWRTLTQPEWYYLFFTRATASGIRYSKATVNGVNGVILLPDDWSVDYYTLSNTNTSGASFSSNVITASQWATLEQHGAVFLPAAGDRFGTSVYNVGSFGSYWSVSYYGTDYAYFVNFNDGNLTASGYDFRYCGLSIRLVCPVENYSIHATPSPSEGGAVSGAGAYQAGAECTLTATASAGYTFAYWTEDGEVVSTDAECTFTVTGERTLVANFTQNGSTGKLNGHFSVGENTMVFFSQGNLQYRASTNTWRFAENQWDFVGVDNSSVSQAYGGLIDLFGWGTSGYNHGAICYQPWSTSTEYSDYYAYGNSNYNLFDQTGQADWGYNAIANGGNQEKSGWRTLTSSEWIYVFNTRTTDSGIRYAKAKVNGVNGVILLPDDWQTSYYSLNSTNYQYANFFSNTITTAQWVTLEQHGAVFLPAAGHRHGTSVYDVGCYGIYWSASLDDYGAVYYLDFSDGGLYACDVIDHYCGHSVRLVRSVENYSFDINAMPSPAEGGAVSGAGTYQAGAECTLTATASAGYTFVNWTENGEVVSNDPVYSFTVTTDRTLMANFEFEPLGDNYWIPDTEPYEDFMAVIGVVQIDGVEQTSTALELGAFCGDECRGSAFAAYFPPTQRYLYQLPVFGNNGDVITFKLYDHAQQMVLDLTGETSLTCSDNGYGTLANPQVINFISHVSITATVTPDGAGTVTGTGEFMPGSTATLLATANEGYAFNCWTENGTVVSTDAEYSFVVAEARNLTACFDRLQTTALGNGWNWFSTFIEQNNSDGLNQLETSLGSNGLIIKSRSGLVVENYDGSYWWGGLTFIDNSQMYEVRTNQACEVSLRGVVAEAQQHPVSIQPGWNWIGYPFDTEMSLSDAMVSLSPSENDMVKSHTTFSTYFPNWGWYGLLETLEPGQGYKYNSYSNSTQTLVYSGTKKGGQSLKKDDPNTHFENHGIGCRDNMNLMAAVLLDDMELNSERYELAAFVNGVCHGSVKLIYVEPIQRYVAFLTVLGDANDAVTFRLYDEETGLTYKAEESVAFKADAVLGNQRELYPIQFKSSVLAESHTYVYPNPVPSGDRVYLEGASGDVVVEITNLLGVIVKSERLSSDASVSCDLAPGVYTVRLTKDQQIVSVHKLIVQ